MQLKVDTEKLRMEIGDLLGVSRMLRKLSAEADCVYSCLRQMSSMDACRAELKRQNNALESLTAELVSMSNALGGISDLYRTSEERNLYRLEEYDRLETATPTVLYRVDAEFGNAINAFLFQ